MNGEGYSVKEMIELLRKDFNQFGDDIKAVLQDHETRIRAGERKDNEGFWGRQMGMWVGAAFCAALVSAGVASMLA